MDQTRKKYNDDDKKLFIYHCSPFSLENSMFTLYKFIPRQKHDYCRHISLSTFLNRSNIILVRMFSLFDQIVLVRLPTRVKTYQPKRKNTYEKSTEWSGKIYPMSVCALCQSISFFLCILLYFIGDPKSKQIIVCYTSHSL